MVSLGYIAREGGGGGSEVCENGDRVIWAENLFFLSGIPVTRQVPLD
jgi:hypothetical protein